MDQLHEVVAPLAIALAQSSMIGLEREFRFKSAGLRTHTLVGVGSALFVLVGKLGFDGADGVPLDGSRVAAQVVTGIGFIGAGLIVFQHDRVRGLTSAAVIWLTAAVGMACGAGLWFAGLVTVVAYYLVMYVYPFLLRRVARSKWSPSSVWVSYIDGRGTLRDVLTITTRRGFSIEQVDVSRDRPGAVEVMLSLTGAGSLSTLAAELDSLDGVVAVRAGAGENELS